MAISWLTLGCLYDRERGNGYMSRLNQTETADAPREGKKDITRNSTLMLKDDVSCWVLPTFLESCNRKWKLANKVFDLHAFLKITN